MEDLSKLHQSQLGAYEKAARLFFKSYVDNYTASPVMEDKDSQRLSQKEYVEKSVENAVVLLSGWKVKQSVIKECLVSEISKKSQEYYVQQKQMNEKNEVNITLKKEKEIHESRRENSSSTPEISPLVGSVDKEKSQDEGDDDDNHDEEITSEEDEDEVENEETESTTIENPSTKSSDEEGNGDGKHKIQNHQKMNNKLSTKISLTKVNKRKRPFTSTALSAKGNARKFRKSANSLNNSANSSSNIALSTQGKKNRSGRGRGRGRRRGGKI